MEPNTPYYASLAYDSEHARDLKKLCRDLGIKQKEFIPLAVEFFQKSGIDPRDRPAEIFDDFRKITKQSENRLIGFIKTQDKTNSEEFNRLYEQIEIIRKATTVTERNMQRMISTLLNND